MYSRDPTGSRFSPLADINAGNVSQLTQAWSVRLTAPAGGEGAARLPPRPPGEAPEPGRGAAAHDPAKARPAAAIRRRRRSSSTASCICLRVATRCSRSTRTRARRSGVTSCRKASRRPRAASRYWPGEGRSAPRILFTAGPRLVALDAQTGQPVGGFGRDGIVEIAVPWNGVPVVYKNVAILGAYPGEVPLGPPGDTRAFDVRTGKKLWQFHNVPLPGQQGHETWLDYGWRGRSGTNVWAFYMTLDEQRGILYMPLVVSGRQLLGRRSARANLFANSIVAVDAETGKYRWHFQTVHHDLWDSDMPSPPVLVDIRQNGRTVPALASIGKTGYMFILDRVTGKPIFGVEERPVPKGEVPDEWYSPTQPFPVKPPRPFARVEFNKERDMVRAGGHVGRSTSPSARRCGTRAAGSTTRVRSRRSCSTRTVRRRASTMQFPGGTGGVNWGGPAADPRTGHGLRQRARHLAGRLDREEEARAELRARHRGIDAALRSRQRERPGAVFQFHRAAQGRQRPDARQPAVPASAVGAPRCRQRQHRRDRLGEYARADRSAAGRQAV